MNLADGFAWLFDGARWGGPSGIGQRLAEHLGLTLAAVALAAVVALPLGVLIGHTRRGAGFVGALTGAFRAVPTLGLVTIFALLLGIGITAPLLALVVLAVPSLLAGAYAGVQSIDPAVPGAARAIGMSPWQVVSRVELPLALPVIVGGIRAATLQVVATATLAAYTADLGLGRFIFAGLKTRDMAAVVGSALLVVLVAVACELLLGALQHLTRRRTRHV